MPQIQLPIFPADVTPITSEIAFCCRDARVYYFNGHLPVFVHDKEDLATFRFFTSQLIDNGTVTQGQISKAFGVPLITVKRYAKLHREKGASAFYTQARQKSGSKLTTEVLVKVQSMLDEGKSVPQTALECSLFANTIHKAIRAGRLHIKKKM